MINDANTMPQRHCHHRIHPFGFAAVVATVAVAAAAVVVVVVL